MATYEVIHQAQLDGKISVLDAKRLIEYNNRLNANNMPIIYNLRHLLKILHIKNSDKNKYFGKERNQYHIFEIPKKSGGMRTIEAPSEELKKYQLWIKENILDKIHISENAKGFRKNCSIVDNAKEHTCQELIINIDLQDFFPSISYKQIIKIFSYIGYTNEVSHLLTQLCTNNRNVLPQGSPASPAISNIVSLKLDARLNGLAKCFECKYTRYADDITFSGKKNIKNILPIAKEIIEEENFIVNTKKVRLQYSFQRQEVTGIIVNKQLGVSPRIKKEIENAIYYCQKYGVDNHMKHIKCDRSFYKEHLYGIAYFVKMIDKPLGCYYLDELDKIGWVY